MSLVTKFEISNYQSIEHAVIEFDETNIIDIKGYNNIGKSAILRAIEAVFADVDSPAAQVKSIRDGAKSFVVKAFFNDGVVITREKYITGGSSWEMVGPSGDVISSTKTKEGKASRNRGIPDPIKQYVGFLYYNAGKDTLNYQNSNKSRFLSATSGSENYDILTSTLGQEGLNKAVVEASKLTNAQKKKVDASYANVTYLADKINEAPEELWPLRENIRSLMAREELAASSVKDLGIANKAADVLANTHVRPSIDKLDSTRAENLYSSMGLHTKGYLTPSRPELKQLSVESVTLLNDVESLYSRYTRPRSPEVGVVNTETYSALNSLYSAATTPKDIRPELNAVSTDVLDLLHKVKESQNSSISVGPKIPEVGTYVLESLVALSTVIESYATHAKNLAKITKDIEALEAKKKAVFAKYNITVCSNCGHPVDKDHNDD